MNFQRQVVVSGAFDDIKSRDLRFLEEAAKFGELTVLLWSDNVIRQVTRKARKFPLAERCYFLNAVRYVSRVVEISVPVYTDVLPKKIRADVWVDFETTTNSTRRNFCAAHDMIYRVLWSSDLYGFPKPPPMPSVPGRKKVIATGCYDWFHSGQVRFIEEASAFGDLYVCLGSDANVRLLKGEGHPLMCQQERRYVVGSIKHVKQALITTGRGCVDAEPEIKRLKPDIYIVNEDGDKGGKREYIQKMNLEYVVLKRTPAPGLAKRSSNDL